MHVEILFLYKQSRQLPLGGTVITVPPIKQEGDSKALFLNEQSPLECSNRDCILCKMTFESPSCVVICEFCRLDGHRVLSVGRAFSLSALLYISDISYTARDSVSFASVRRAPVHVVHATLSWHSSPHWWGVPLFSLFTHLFSTFPTCMYAILHGECIGIVHEEYCLVLDTVELQCLVDTLGLALCHFLRIEFTTSVFSTLLFLCDCHCSEHRCCNTE